MNIYLYKVNKCVGKQYSAVGTPALQYVLCAIYIYDRSYQYVCILCQEKCRSILRAVKQMCFLAL